MSILDDVLIITNYHTRNLFYEKTVERMYHYGFTNWYIQNTSADPRCYYQGIEKSGIKVTNVGHQNVFSGLKFIWEAFYKDPPEQNIIIHLDDDVYVHYPEGVEEYLEEFVDDGYDCAGPYADYYCNEVDWPNKLLIPINSVWLPKQNQCKDTVSTPFISGCLSIFNAETFYAYDPSEWAIEQMRMQYDGLKRGAFDVGRPPAERWKSNQALCWTSDFVHVGNIALFWYLLLGKIGYDHKNSFFMAEAHNPEHLFRIGYLMAQVEYLGLPLEKLLDTYFKKTGTTAALHKKEWNKRIKDILPLKGYEL